MTSGKNKGYFAAVSHAILNLASGDWNRASRTYRRPSAYADEDPSTQVDVQPKAH